MRDMQSLLFFLRLVKIDLVQEIGCLIYFIHWLQQ
jgi:hypothetical protein